MLTVASYVYEILRLSVLQTTYLQISKIAVHNRSKKYNNIYDKYFSIGFRVFVDFYTIKDILSFKFLVNAMKSFSIAYSVRISVICFCLKLYGIDSILKYIIIAVVIAFRLNFLFLTRLFTIYFHNFTLIFFSTKSVRFK